MDDKNTKNPLDLYQDAHEHTAAESTTETIPFEETASQDVEAMPTLPSIETVQKGDLATLARISRMGRIEQQRQETAVLQGIESDKMSASIYAGTLNQRAKMDYWVKDEVQAYAQHGMNADSKKTITVLIVVADNNFAPTLDSQITEQKLRDAVMKELINSGLGEASGIMSIGIGSPSIVNPLENNTESEKKGFRDVQDALQFPHIKAQKIVRRAILDEGLHELAVQVTTGNMKAVNERYKTQEAFKGVGSWQPEQTR